MITSSWEQYGLNKFTYSKCRCSAKLSRHPWPTPRTPDGRRKDLKMSWMAGASQRLRGFLYDALPSGEAHRLTHFLKVSPSSQSEGKSNCWADKVCLQHHGHLILPSRFLSFRGLWVFLALDSECLNLTCFRKILSKSWEPSLAKLNQLNKPKYIIFFRQLNCFDLPV